MIKKILIILLSLVFLLIVAVVSIPFLFKDQIFEIVKTEINKNVVAQVDFGDFDLTLIKNFPDLTVTITDLKVVGLGEFEGDTLADIQEITATVDIMSVINGEQIAIKTIRIDKPNLLVKVMKDGKANYDIAPPSEESDEPEETTDDAKFKISLQNYEFNNANIVYDDATLPCYVKIEDLTHKGEGDFTQDLFLLQTLTTIKAIDVVFEGVTYFKKTNARFKFDLEMDMPNSKYTFKENEIQLNDFFLGFDGFVAMPDTNIDMDVNFFTRKSTFKSLLSMIPSAYTADFADVKTDGKLQLDGFAKGTYNAVSLPAFSLNLLVEDAMFKYPDLAAGVNNIQIDLRVDNPDGVDDHTVINIPRFHIEFDKEPFDAKIVVKTPVSDPYIDVEIKGKIDLDQITKTFPLEDDMKVSGIINMDIALKGNLSTIEQEKYEEFDASGQMNITNLVYNSPDMAQELKINQSQITFNPRNLGLTSFDCQIGKSDIRANGSIENYLAYALNDDMLKGSLNLSSNYFDADEWMEDETEAEAGTGGGSSVAAEDTSALEIIEVPGNLDFVMNISFKKVLYDGMYLENVKGAMRVKDQGVTMNDLSVDVLGGNIVTNGIYSTKDIERPKFIFDLAVADVDIQKSFKQFVTVQKMAPIAEYTTGKVSLNFDVTGILMQDMMPDLNSLAGSGNFLIPHAEIKGYKPLEKLREAVKIKELEKMELNNAKGSFKFEDGRIHVDPFDVKQAASKMTISGSNGFDQTIDYLVKAEIPRKSFGSEANALVDNLLSFANQQGANISIDDMIKVDITIGGTVTNPIIKTGFKDVIGDKKQDLKDRAKEELEKKKKELEDKARKEAEKLKKDAQEKAKKEAERLKKEAAKIMKEAEKKAAVVRSNAKKAAEKVSKEGYAQADKLVSQAKNPVSKAAAKKAASKLKKETDAKANKIKSEGDKKAKKILDEARKRAKNLK
ncbi:hypothetical protein JYT51_00295 [Candidatus Amoebophilus asiaticus]|nr:hypothetical protein [Candidatus Amoebophilus asiaticus]